jgi:hypothetical protein
MSRDLIQIFGEPVFNSDGLSGDVPFFKAVHNLLWEREVEEHLVPEATEFINKRPQLKDYVQLRKEYVHIDDNALRSKWFEATLRKKNAELVRESASKEKETLEESLDTLSAQHQEEERLLDQKAQERIRKVGEQAKLRQKVASFTPRLQELQQLYQQNEKNIEAIKQAVNVFQANIAAERAKLQGALVGLGVEGLVDVAVAVPDTLIVKRKSLAEEYQTIKQQQEQFVTQAREFDKHIAVENHEVEQLRQRHRGLHQSIAEKTDQIEALKERLGEVRKELKQVMEVYPSLEEKWGRYKKLEEILPRCLGEAQEEHQQETAREQREQQLRVERGAAEKAAAEARAIKGQEQQRAREVAEKEAAERKAQEEEEKKEKKRKKNKKRRDKKKAARLRRRHAEAEEAKAFLDERTLETKVFNSCFFRENTDSCFSENLDNIANLEQGDFTLLVSYFTKVHSKEYKDITRWPVLQSAVHSVLAGVDPALDEFLDLWEIAKNISLTLSEDAYSDIVCTAETIKDSFEMSEEWSEQYCYTIAKVCVDTINLFTDVEAEKADFTAAALVALENSYRTYDLSRALFQESFPAVYAALNAENVRQAQAEMAVARG